LLPPLPHYQAVAQMQNHGRCAEQVQAYAQRRAGSISRPLGRGMDAAQP
jgi:hypothetical protein